MSVTMVLKLENKGISFLQVMAIYGSYNSEKSGPYRVVRPTFLTNQITAVVATSPVCYNDAEIRKIEVCHSHRSWQSVESIIVKKGSVHVIQPTF